MSDTILRARSITEIVDAAFALYRRNLPQYILITGVAYSPALVASLILQSQGQSASITAALLSLVLSLVGYFLMYSTITAFGSQVYLSEGDDVGVAVRRALPRIPAILVSSIVMAFLYIVGFLCFIVGFFYVAARFFGVVQAIVLENKGPFAALGRSSKLSDGRMGHVLGTILLVYALYILVSTGISIALGLIGSPMLVLLVSTFFTIVAFPVVGLTILVLYYDTRIRAEGFDIERMTQGIAGMPHGDAAPAVSST